MASNAKFCSQCASPLPEPNPPFCSQCGTAVKPNNSQSNRPSQSSRPSGSSDKPDRGKELWLGGTRFDSGADFLKGCGIFFLLIIVFVVIVAACLA